jgi:hypothetical protein
MMHLLRIHRIFSPWEINPHLPMQFQLRRICFFLFACLLTITPLRAQDVLQSDAGLPQKQVQQSNRQVSPAANSRITTINLPFFDDFSAGESTPDTARWAFHPLDTKRPGISIQKGHNVPSKGVATFDGVNMNGIKYEIDLSAGIADTLTSQPIDLSAFSVADSVYLSFFVQRGGTGEAPEAFDSIVVWFDSTGDYEYVEVWSLPGNGAAETNFQHFHILLDSAKYFHDAFRFKFVSNASLNGELDQFHLDYVYMNAGRTLGDANYNDASVARLAHSPIHPWTAMPSKLYPGGTLMTDTRVLVSNAGNPATSANLELVMDDPTGNNIFSGTTLVTATLASLPAFGHDTVNASAFSDQSANIVDFGALRVSVRKTGPADSRAANDSLHVTYRLDSTLALDDGVSDFGYGLPVARAFCQQYEIPRPDTMVAVWIHFAPSIYFNQQTQQSFDLSGKGFRLVVWDSLSVDSSLIETSGGMNVDYGTSLNEFIRYQLIAPAIVPQTFWVGIRQADGQPIGMGFDKNSRERRVYYENADAEFQLSTNVGALMIRPEFKTPTPPVGVNPEMEVAPLVFEVAPQPIRENRIRLVFSAELGGLRDMTFQLVDLQGRTMQQWSGGMTGREVVLPVADGLADGIYLLQVNGRDGKGNIREGWKKVMVAGN